MMTTGEFDPEKAPGHTVGSRVAECFAAEPPLGNRICHIVCCGFPCGKQEVEEKTVPAVLKVLFSGAKVTFGQKGSPL
jgi:hypothetical protein